MRSGLQRNAQRETRTDKPGQVLIRDCQTNTSDWNKPAFIYSIIKISHRRGFWSRGIARALSHSLHHPISPVFDGDSLKRTLPEGFGSPEREMTSQWALKENQTLGRSAKRCEGKETKRGSHERKRYAKENWRCKFHICPLKLRHKTDETNSRSN